MIVTVTMEQVIDFRNNNGEFLGSATLPLKGAYKLNKIRKALDKEGEFYGERFQEIINTYAQKDKNGEVVFNDDGTQIMIQEDKLEECEKALSDLQNLEVQVENYNLTIEDLGENIECTPNELAILMPFME